MGKCKYILWGRTFNSELELDSFIQSNQHLLYLKSDVVFSKQGDAIDKLNTLQEESARIKSKQVTKKVTIDENGEEIVEYNRPYLGVNRFLSGLTVNGKLLFPEFREDLYWNNRYEAWKKGNFSEQELKQLPVTQGVPIVDVDQQLKLKESMQLHWKNLAAAGKVTHTIMESFFNDPNMYLSMTNTQVAKDLYLKLESMVKSELRDYKINDIVSPQIIMDNFNLAKQLYQKLITIHGPNAKFYTEQLISGKANQDIQGKGDTLLGYIDLLVIDEQGAAHIYDYKTSNKPYAEWSDAKKRAFKYQIATYDRILKQAGLNYGYPRLGIIPIIFNNMDDKDSQGYASKAIRIASTSFDNDAIIEDFTQEINDPVQPYQENLSEFLLELQQEELSGKEVLHNVVTNMQKMFPDYRETKAPTREEVIEELKEANAFEKKDNGYEYKFRNSERPIIAKTEQELVEKVLKIKTQLINSSHTYAKMIKHYLTEAQNGNPLPDLPEASFNSTTDNSATWLQDVLTKYATPNYKILEHPVLDSYSMIAVQNLYTHQVDIIKLSGRKLTNLSRKPDGSENITRAFENDLEEQRKQDSLILKAYQGNIELMEVMAVMNELSSITNNFVLGDLKVINPKYANQVSASNEELLYSWNKLAKHAGLETNNYKEGNIKMIDLTQKVQNQYIELFEDFKNNPHKDSKINSIMSCKPEMDMLIDGNIDDKKRTLNKLRAILENKYPELKKPISDRSLLLSPHTSLYVNILQTLSAYDNLTLRQQLEDSSKWIESMKIWKDGVQGSYIDNPGMLNNETLNNVTKLVNRAYQNVRQDMEGVKAKIRDLVNKLKERKNYTLLEEGTIGYQASLYKNLYTRTSQGDWVFKHINDPELIHEEKELLTYALTIINKKRFPFMSEQDLTDKILNNDVFVYRVPLTYGDSSSRVSEKGFWNAVKDKLAGLMPAEAFSRAQAKVQGIFSNPYENSSGKESLFIMGNMFDAGEDETKRMEMIEHKGVEYFEHNLETLLFKHQAAYSIQQRINEVFPLIKASYMHIALKGAEQGTSVENHLSYLTDYIRSAILNESIVPKKFQKANQVISKLKSAASLLTLGFSAKAGLYQIVQGLWTDIALIVRNPDGKNTFTFKNFLNAFRIVYSDMFHYSRTATKTQLFNELFGINDMDMNQYGSKLSSDNSGIFNFQSEAMKWSARPDYYNRMVIMTTQMIADGTYDAYEVKDGRLVYDWTKDKRLEKFAKNPTLNTSDPEYNKQKALYIALAQEMVREKVLNPDGTPFELNMNNPKPLPKAYTTKQLEGYKALSDNIYGYYAHEKQSLIKQLGLGSMWLQFRTFWSSKKNQYLQKGGVKMQGSYVPIPGLFYKLNDDGTVSDEYTNEDTGMPVYKWEGQWEEGIIMSLSQLLDTTNNTSIGQNWANLWNDQTSKGVAFRSNIRKLLADMIMFFVIGGIIGSMMLEPAVEDMDKHRDKKDIGEAILQTGANLAVSSLMTSVADMNFMDSIGQPLVNWQPFVLSWSQNIYKNIGLVLGGDWQKALINSSGTTKQLKPLLKTILVEN